MNIQAKLMEKFLKNFDGTSFDVMFETGEEIQIVEEYTEDINKVIKTVNDKKLLDILEVEFAKKF